MANTSDVSTSTLNVIGVSTLGGNLNISAANIVLGDSGGATDDRIVLGAGSDLSIYHDATNSYVSNSTGVLRIRSNDLRLQSATGEEYFYGTADGGAHIYLSLIHI